MRVERVDPPRVGRSHADREIRAGRRQVPLERGRRFWKHTCPTHESGAVPLRRCSPQPPREAPLFFANNRDRLAPGREQRRTNIPVARFARSEPPCAPTARSGGLVDEED